VRLRFFALVRLSVSVTPTAAPRDLPRGGEVARGGAVLRVKLERVLQRVKARPEPCDASALGFCPVAPLVGGRVVGQSSMGREVAVAGFLKDKAVVVTGAGNGIGRAVAIGCAAEGANVVVADLGVGLAGEDPTSEVADAVVQEIEQAGGEAVAVADNVATWEGGKHIVDTCVENYGRIDGAVCVAGILRERMLFNMSEDEFDAVIAVHLKGHFTVYRHAAAIMRKQESGSLVGFTSGAYAGSIAQANYSAAKGGIVSLTRSAAAGLHRYGIRANCIAPVARTRMSANVPMELADMGEPEDIAPMVVYLLSDASAHVTGQVYTAVGSKIAVWNQPVEVREMTTEGRWTPEDIASRLDSEVGQEKMGLIERAEAYRKAAASGQKPNA
jgi:NAD(P)-dependent dehydrogenase (short-subunit alcohol dehydrogenase family)